MNKIRLFYNTMFQRNLRMNLLNVLQITVINLFVVGGQADHQCCSPDGLIADKETCVKSGVINLPCHEKLILSSDTIYYNYLISTDKEGDYLDAVFAGYTIREPYFCTGLINSTIFNNISEAAIVCLSYRNWYDEASTIAPQKHNSTINRIRLLIIISIILNTLSFIAFMITAAVYYFLPEAQDLQGKCYFHFALISGLGHGTLTYLMIFDTKGLLPNMCITNVYLAVYMTLCGFMWSLTMNFNVWRHTCNRSTDDENKLLNRYKLFSYGIPALIILCVWIHVHLQHFAEYDLSFVLACYEHEKTIFSGYLELPILIIILFHFFMFIDCQRRIWNMHLIQPGERNVTTKIIKYRVIMNARLFFMMGIPWVSYLLSQFTASVIGSYYWSLMAILGLLIFCEGIPIFLILVVFRKRILRGIATRWLSKLNFIPEKWKNVNDSGTEEEYEEQNDGIQRNNENNVV